MNKEEAKIQFGKSLWQLDFDQKRWKQFVSHIDTLDTKSKQVYADTVIKLEKSLPIQDMFVYRSCKKKYDSIIEEHNFFCDMANRVRNDIMEDYKNISECVYVLFPDNLDLINSYKVMINEMEADNVKL